MATVVLSNELSKVQSGTSHQTARGEEYAQANMAGADRLETRRAIAASVTPSALNEVPIHNQAIVNYAYKVLGADGNYNFARQEMMKRFGVDLAKAESDRQGISSIKLTRENGSQVQNELVERFKGFAGTHPLQATSNQTTTDIPRAIPLQEVPNQKLINYAYNILKVEQRGIAAERDLKVMFGVDLDSLLADRTATSTIQVRKGPGGNEAALRQVLNASPEKPEAAAEPRLKPGKNAPTSAPAQPSTPEIPRAIPAEEVSNQKLINFAYNVLKVEQRGIVAERQFKATFGVDLDSLLANRGGTSTIEIKQGPGGNEGAVRAVLNPGPTTASVSSQPERNLGREEFIARTVIEPGRGLFKTVRDTITDMQGNTVVATERTRVNLGALSFNVPGTRYKVPDGVPEDQARALAKKHIQDVSRRN